ncbi:MAG: hypothetical protein HQK87_00415 [Nitrospinae bacterium]|nr:hypothetical protein [Nitrospinota bacterium]
MNDTLVLITRPLAEVPAAKRAAALSVAAEAILLENGVYTTAAEAHAAGLDAATLWVVTDDADARRVTSPFPGVGWDGVVDAIERNRAVITL